MLAGIGGSSRSRAPRPPGRPRRYLLVALAALWLSFPGAAVSTAAEMTRPEYVARLEKICKPGSEATRRAVRGMRSDIRSERLQLAASKFSKAKRIFAATVDSISTVPRPAEDVRTLARWFAALERESVYLGRIAASLRAEDIARFQRVQGQFSRQGSKANNIVVSFGFDYCAYKPSRFE
jgi:hypothetical protein